MKRKLSDYTGSAEHSEGWKEFGRTHSVSDRKPMLKSLVRQIHRKQARSKAMDKIKTHYPF